MKTKVLSLLLSCTLLLSVRIHAQESFNPAENQNQENTFEKECYNPFLAKDRDMIQLVDSIVSWQFPDEGDSVYASKVINIFNDLKLIESETRLNFVDSTQSWVNSQQFLYEYDVFGNVNQYIYQQWSEEEMTWVNFSMNVYEYNELDLRTRWEMWRYNAELEEWYGFRKYVYEYDDDENKTFEQYWDWNNETSDWKNNKYTEWNFGEFGETSMLRWKWDMDSAEWYGDMRTEKNYDALGNDTLSISWNWPEDTWVYKYMYRKTYDEFGNHILIYMFDWNNDSLQWYNMRKTEMEYHESGEYSLMLDSDWSEDLQEYIQARMWTREFSETGLIMLWEYSKWEVDKGDWIPNWKHDFEYDDFENEIYNAKWLYDKNNEIWYGNFKNEAGYTGNNQLQWRQSYWWSSDVGDWEGTSFYVNMYDNEGFLCKIVNFGWDTDEWDWYLTTQDYYYYRIVMDIEENNADILQIYPNPATSYFVINTKHVANDIKIYSMNAKLVKHIKNYKSGDAVDVQYLDNGIYLIQLNYKKNIKFIKQ